MTMVARYGNEPETEQLDLRGTPRIIVTADVLEPGSPDGRAWRALEAAFRAGASALGQPWEQVERLGDGLRIVMSPDTTPLPPVLDSFVTHLAAGADDGTQVRLSVHFGFVDRAAGTWSGTPLVHAARLVNAAEARQRLADNAHARLAVIVSEYVHAQIVRQRCPGVYQRIMVLENDAMAAAWVRIV